MSIFGGFFEKEPKRKGSETNVSKEKSRLDDVDIQANREMAEIERDAIRAKSITEFLVKHIEEIMQDRPDIFSGYITLKDFIEELEERSDEPEFLAIKQQLEHFISLFKDEVNSKNTLANFMKVLKNREIMSDQILHPE